jgi:hypothetical protein
LPRRTRAAARYASPVLSPPIFPWGSIRATFFIYKILTTDGTLFPTNARYKGCTHFCDSCNFIEFKGVIENVRQRILYRLKNPEKIVPGKEIRIKLLCPSSNCPDDAKHPKVELLSLFLKEMDTEQPSIFNGIFELEKELNEARLDLMVKRGVFTRFVAGDNISSDAFFFKCPKLPLRAVGFTSRRPLTGRQE